MHNLWQVHYQVLLILLQKEFIKINVKIVIVFSNMNVSKTLIKHKCLSCNKDYSNKLDEKLKKRFKNSFEFSNNNISKCILLPRNSAYHHEYMDDWGKFNETTLSEK